MCIVGTIYLQYRTEVRLPSVYVCVYVCRVCVCVCVCVARSSESLLTHSPTQLEAAPALARFVGFSLSPLSVRKSTISTVMLSHP